MSGLLLDIALLGVVVLCAWMGFQLGAEDSIVRCVATLSSFGFALALATPIGALLEAVSPVSGELGRMVGMVIAGAMAYVGIAAVAGYRHWWEPHAGQQRMNAIIGGVPGVVVGVVWSGAIIVSMLLVPANGIVFKAASTSLSGTAIMDHAAWLPQRIVKVFPEHMQTLPKGEFGAEVGETDQPLGLRPGRVVESPDAAGTLLANINEYRRSRGIVELAWNRDLAEAGTRHSRAMYNEHVLSTKPRQGISVESRIKLALGNSVGLYETFGAEVVWAHGVANAFDGIVRSRTARALVLDRHMTEIGIGVIDTGWFDNELYTLALIGRAGTELPEEKDEGEVPGNTIGGDTVDS